MENSKDSTIENADSIPLTGVLDENDDPSQVVPSFEFKTSTYWEKKLRWKNIIIILLTHIIGTYGFWCMFTSAKLLTTLFAFIMYQVGSIGVTAGAHRLWSHRAYKVTWQLKLILLVMETVAFEGSAIYWARNHRLHHKYSETDADPHNATRGFFFSHMGWLLVRRHPQIFKKVSSIDLSDLFEDKMVAIQHDYYYHFLVLFSALLPTLIPMYLWNETFINSFCLNVFRFVFTLHAIWSINSAAHLYGNKPYDKSIMPSENLLVSLLACGEGWHNYHHTFPWDYKAQELGKYSVNFSAAFIDFFAKIGWAYDLKTVSEEMIKKRILRTGDGSHNIWGWGDKDQPKEDYRDAIIVNKRNEINKTD